MSVPLYVGNIPNRLTGPETFSADTDIYHAWLPTAITAWNADITALSTNDTRDTSTSSVLIGAGTKVFTVSTGKSFSAGQWLTISSTPSPTNQMIANVTSYSGTTLTVTVPANGVFGSGTLANWTLALTAAPSAEVSAAMAPVTAAATLAAGRTALDVPGNTDLFAGATVGNYIVSNNFIQRLTTSTTAVLLKETKVMRAGAYRIRFTLNPMTDGFTAYGRIYKNGVAVGTQRSSATLAPVIFTEDLSSFAVGDLIQVYGYIGTSGYTCSVSTFQLCVATPVFYGENNAY